MPGLLYAQGAPADGQYAGGNADVVAFTLFDYLGTLVPGPDGWIDPLAMDDVVLQEDIQVNADSPASEVDEETEKP